MTTKRIDIAAAFPAKLAPIFEPHRFKVIYGGRGGGKSWSIARALLLIGHNTPTRILCAREFMQSIQDSVHRLLCDQIEELGLSAFYDIERHIIRGANGTSFRFAGIKNNVQQIKSFEKIGICWLEECDNVSRHSLDILIPTLRAPGSELWMSWNPQFETDEVWRRFILNTPPGTVVIRMNYADNPWFPDELRREAEYLKETNYDDYAHIYGGEFRRYIDGAVYLHELRQAEKESRITRVPYDPNTAVHAFLDLGYADATAIWFVQKVGFETHWIDYLENRQRPLDFYLKQITSKPYPVDFIHLPHDARAKSLGTGKSIEEIVRAKGFQTRIVPSLAVADGINAVRQTLATSYFDADACADGLTALRHYRFEVAEDKGFKSLPVHDRWSHGADAARYVAVGLRPPRAKPDIKSAEHSFRGGNTGWMTL